MPRRRLLGGLMRLGRTSRSLGHNENPRSAATTASTPPLPPTLSPSHRTTRPGSLLPAAWRVALRVGGLAPGRAGSEGLARRKPVEARGERVGEAGLGTAPIPAPRDGADGVGGAAPGPRGREAGSTARSEVCTAAGGGGVKYFCDVHRTRRNGEGFRITYTTDGESFRYADGFEELPAGSGDGVFVDTIPVQHTDGVIELLRRGVEVYYLRRLTLAARRREELKLPKSEKGDVRALMSIEEKWFRRITEDFLAMRRMIAAYRALMRAHRQLLNNYKALSDLERYVMNPAIKALEERMEVMASKIVDEAGRRYPAYNKLVEELGINSLLGKEALAEIITYLDHSKGFRKTVNLFGLFKPVRGKKKIYSGHLRRALQRLTASVNRLPSFQLTARMEKEILFKVWMILRQEARGRLDAPAQG